MKDLLFCKGYEGTSLALQFLSSEKVQQQDAILEQR